MNLINKKLVLQKIATFPFPDGEKKEGAKKLIEGWQKALKDSDLDKTKEKSVQGKFLSTFFEAILGYSDQMTGQDEWTLIQHPRIENDSKEPDGSLGFFTKDIKNTRVVIELKDARTSLDKRQNRGSEKLTPIEQAYLYATKYDGCKWLIVSNFREIRLYNKNKTQENYEKFNVMDLLSEEEFKRFYFFFCKDNLIATGGESTIDVMANETMIAEKDITKKFYAGYRQARLSLLDHLIENNPEIEKTLLLEKTQKFLDRFVFTLFCEDTSSLLPLNLIKNTYERAINSLSPSDERVWNEFKGLFLAIDKGNSRVQPPINAYNGGLFAHDDILDNLKIKDEFWKQLMHLTEYDFETDINVNILGHIFEQSISDLESLKSELRGEEQDKKKSKRKKDGIYYTPEYITRYIVENTVGKYLEEYPEKLNTIKILDPACGSGAFLNQAHTFLMNEYKIRHESLINEKIGKGESITLFDYNPAENNREILLNNLYGVDLNQESVEISKLALWLKTARKTEPLQNLDKNIKCGNSIISNPEIAGKKAFDWDIEYKDIMDDGGFDVLIGNPPWGAEFTNPEKEYLKDRYQEISGEVNSYLVFILNSLEKLKKGGILGFIIPDGWTESKRWDSFRKRLLENYDIQEIDLFRKNIFIDAPDIIPTILIVRNKKSSNNKTVIKRIGLNTPIDNLHLLDWIDSKMILQDWWLSQPYNLITINQTAKLMHLYERFYQLEKVADTLNPQESRYVYISDGVYKSKITNLLKNEGTKEACVDVVIQGAELQRYHITTDNLSKLSVSEVSQLLTKTELSKYCEDKLVFHALKKPSMSNRLSGTYIEKSETEVPNIIFSNNFIVITKIKEIGLKFLLGLMNSKLINRFYNDHFLSVNIEAYSVGSIPLPTLKNSELIENFVMKMISLGKEFNELQNSINEIVSAKYAKQTGVLEFNLGDIGFNELLEKLSIKGVDLKIEEVDELQQWFKPKQHELISIREKIKNLDFQIDQEVYKLYGLTQEEINIIEKSE